jgi:8-oxo-dGTP diphosphatase
MDPESAEVKAAGGVVWRRGPGGVEVAVAHRPHRGDWSLPKGKLDPGESWEEAALREVHEETGLRCTLGAELSSQDYIDRKGRPKTVRWWAMTVVSDDGLTPSHEVDERRWIAVEHAERLLDYEHDRALVREAVEAS